ncbi:hypothetical protein ACIQYW_13665 [Rhodococcus erythropolis]|uniref:hypothetical protein n=1 Tax=Rhodococcus baikonurensis TaxID=172041 RepID=UPI00260D8862|nr:hypothetical protein [uncultured Rhodococcus sp.]
MTMRVGFSFEDDQLGERGWFVDTDALDESVDRCAERLAGGAWPEIFELDNETIGVTTRYVRSH